MAAPDPQDNAVVRAAIHPSIGVAVLSAGPTPRVPVGKWDFAVHGLGLHLARWSWDEFQALPHETITKDIHCVTKWSNFDTVWEGVSVDTLLAEAARHGVEPAPFVMATQTFGAPAPGGARSAAPRRSVTAPAPPRTLW
jgi:DMSO/TMAO reductase YedYZ molybdopterin-dependent catalytic subunit